MQNGRPALSVVVCTLGGEVVREAVESVVASAENSGHEAEIVVVWQSADPLPDLDGGVRVLRVFSAGISNARNRGLSEASAPLLGYVDDDEVVDPGWVAAVVKALQGEIAGVFGPVAPRDDRGLAYCRYDGHGTARVFRGRRVPPWVVGTGGNMAFQRSALLDVGGFDAVFGAGSIARSGEDTEVIARLLRAGYSLLWTPEMVVYHPTKTEAERLASRFPYAYGMGKIMRRHRDPMLAARYLRTIGQVVGRAVVDRDRRRLREAAATMRGFGTGVALRAAGRSPEWVPHAAPDAVQDALDGAGLEPGQVHFRPDPHLVYFVGEDRVLHVYVNPTKRLRAGLAARERIRERSGLREIPRLHALAEATDVLWVLEERMRGRPPRPSARRRWFPAAAGWAASLPARAGEPVRETRWWDETMETVVAEAPPSLRLAVGEAFEIVGELPARPLHGDFQPKNILVDRNALAGVLDWEHAYEAGFPGLDLLFLAVMAQGWPPDAEIARRLSLGQDPDWAPLSSLLGHVGLDPHDLRAPLLAALAVWAHDENVRLAVPGMPHAAPAYRQLLVELGPRLT